LLSINLSTKMLPILSSFTKLTDSQHSAMITQTHLPSY